MMLSVGIEQSSDHALVLCVMLASFSFKVINASFAQGNRHLDSFIPKDEFFGTR
jgi:urease accessory protein UreE